MKGSDEEKESRAERWCQAVLGQAEYIASTLRALSDKVDAEVKRARGAPNEDCASALDRLVSRVQLQVELGTEQLEREAAMMTRAWTHYTTAKGKPFPDGRE